MSSDCAVKPYAVKKITQKETPSFRHDVFAPNHSRRTRICLSFEYAKRWRREQYPLESCDRYGNFRKFYRRITCVASLPVDYEILQRHIYGFYESQ